MYVYMYYQLYDPSTFRFEHLVFDNRLLFIMSGFKNSSLSFSLSWFCKICIHDIV